MALAHVTLPTGPTVSYEDSGGGGTPVIFSHGLFMDHTMFDAQVAEFAGAYRCITWDERAHGGTGWNAPFTYWDSGRDLIALMDALGIHKCIHVGMSQGGLLGMRAAILAPERFTGIVQLATQAGTLEGAEPFRAFIDGWKADGADADKLTFLTDLILGPGIDPAYWYAYWKTFTPDQLETAVAPLFAIDALYDRLHEVTVPVCTIHGLADFGTSHALAERVAREVPDPRGVTLIEDGPHAVNISHAAQVNAALRTFFDELA
ncbi:alpha/beta fold hydrolase [Novosphingobium lentum]|uniref:alpha/beta fold hydrolase n=1 Tax=Novosphingobium lentum TaxID=145287 RepID=UPI000830162E|nr:alpha/beta hydrolase [Novosphingobium lentum]